MLLGAGRHSVYKSCIQSADHETPEMLASAAAILHAGHLRAQPRRLGNGEDISQDRGQGNALCVILHFQEQPR